jgi:hypothetical protein
VVHVGVDDDLPAYLSGPGADDAAPPAMDLARAGARRLAAALAEARTAFLDTPREPVLDAGASLTGAAGDWFPPARRTAQAVTGGFLRMVELPGLRLGAMLDEWWSTSAVDGWSAVDNRLRLRVPHRDHLGGFTVQGRIRRVAHARWTPVVIELWPRHGQWTMVTMTPQAGVLATRRYFRAGHTAIDRLTRTLAATGAASA